MATGGAPIRKARRKNLLPLHFEQRSVPTQTEDIDITRFLFGGKVARSLKGSTERKLRQALQIIESYKVKLTIGIEKYTQLKQSLLQAERDKLIVEKEMEKKVEKFDHKLAKLQDRIYKLKDKLEEKDNAYNRLEEDFNALRDKYAAYEEDESEESEEESDDEVAYNYDRVVHEIEIITSEEEFNTEFSTEPEPSDVETNDEGLPYNEDALDYASDMLRDDTSVDGDDTPRGGVCEHELEEVIEDMTKEREFLQSKIEELEKRLSQEADKKEELDDEDNDDDEDEAKSTTSEEGTGSSSEVDSECHCEIEAKSTKSSSSTDNTATSEEFISTDDVSNFEIVDDEVHEATAEDVLEDLTDEREMLQIRLEELETRLEENDKQAEAVTADTAEEMNEEVKPIVEVPSKQISSRPNSPRGPRIVKVIKIQKSNPEPESKAETTEDQPESSDKKPVAELDSGLELDKTDDENLKAEKPATEEDTAALEKDDPTEKRPTMVYY